jgi:hypothetical protein
MNGIGNKLSAQAEKSQRDAAIENFAQRAEKLGKWPGTHTLGKEFETPKKV